MPAMKNIAVKAGDDVAQPFELLDENGDALNLTGATVTMTVRTKPKNSGDLVFQKVTPTQIAVDAPATLGTGTIDIDAADTTDLSGAYYFDLVVLKSGRTRTVLEGQFVVNDHPGR